MLKYELLKLTFQGVLRIMILRFYCAVFNLKSKWLFKLQVEIYFLENILHVFLVQLFQYYQIRYFVVVIMDSKYQ